MSPVSRSPAPSLWGMHRPILRGLRASLWDLTPRDHREPDLVLRRRQVVCVATVLVGALVLAASLRIEPGSAWFYPATLGLAAVWATGALVAGPLHLGRIGTAEGPARPVVQPLLIGLALALVFVVGALVVREIEPLAVQVRRVLEHADQGVTLALVVITALNGVAEELFFRGAGYAAIPRHPVVWTTAAYAVTTAATGNVMLAFAAVLLGIVVGLQRRASGGILAPAITHVTWSLTMLLALPAVLG